MIDQCIYEVYKREKKVFIPDFGAILYSEYDDGVDFNSLLDFDDGKVIAQISKQQFLSEDDARNALEVYVKEIKNSLADGKSVFFGGIGYLSQDDSGAISIQKAKSSYKSRKRSKPTEVKEEVIGKDEDASETSSDLPLPDHVEASQNKDESDSVSVHSSDQAETDEYPINKVDSEEDPSYPWSEDDDSLVAEEESDLLFDDDAERDQHTQRKRKALKVAVLWFIPLALLAVGAYYTLDRTPVAEDSVDPDDHTALANAQVVKNVETVELASYSSEDEEAVAVEESQPEDATQEPAPKPESKPAPVVDSRSSGELAYDDNKNYSLILGSFKIEQNADNYEQKLRSRGIEVIKFQGRNNFYFVGYENIEGKSRAMKLLMEVKEENPSAWIINRERLSL